MTHKISIIKATKNIALLYFSLLLCSSAHAQIITTVAGNGTGIYSGDGGPASSAGIPSGGQLTFDKTGNLYFCDSVCIRRITTDGTINRYAGSTTSGYAGDGGPATAALLGLSPSVTVDTIGNVYIGDYLNYVIRKVDIAGTITNYAGTGTAGHTGDGGPATAAEFNLPTVGAVDAYGGILVTENASSIYFRKIDVSGTVTTIASNGASGFSGDNGPATAASFCNRAAISGLDLHGNILITDQSNQRIRIIDASGIVRTIAGSETTASGSSCGYITAFAGDGGPATTALLHNPSWARSDPSGNIYFIDNRRVRKIDTIGIITTVAGTGLTGSTGDWGPATAAEMQPISLAVDCAGNVFVFDYGGYSIRKIWFDHRPVFTEGSTQSFTICSDTPGVALGAMLAVMDTDAGQTETWSILRGAGHGTLSGSSFIATSTGGTLAPTGYTYVPASGFTGTDTFSIQISDCADKNTATFYVTVSGCSLGTTYTAAHTTGLQVTPNPGNGNFTALLSAGVNEAAYFVLTDITGKVILSAQGQTNRPTLMQATAPPGIYVLQATTAHGRYTAKIQVE